MISLIPPLWRSLLSAPGGKERIGLGGSLVLLNLFDAFESLRLGGVELNPIAAVLLASPALFLLLKISIGTMAAAVLVLCRCSWILRVLVALYALIGLGHLLSC